MDINELTYLINGAVYEVNRVLGAGLEKKRGKKSFGFWVLSDG